MDEAMDSNNEEHIHDIPESSTARDDGEETQAAKRLKRVREQNREWQRRRQQRLSSEALTQQRERHRQLEHARVHNMTPEQQAQRLERRRLSQRMRRLSNRSEQTVVRPHLQINQQRDRRRDYARQRRASLNTEQREEQLARRRSNYRQRRLAASTANSFNGVPRRRRSINFRRRPRSSPYPTFYYQHMTGVEMSSNIPIQGSTANIFNGIPTRIRSAWRRPRLSPLPPFNDQGGSTVVDASWGVSIEGNSFRGVRRSCRSVPLPTILEEGPQETTEIRCLLQYAPTHSTYEHGSTSACREETRHQLPSAAILEEFKQLDDFDRFNDEQDCPSDPKVKKQLKQFSVYSPGWGFSVRVNRTWLRELILREFKAQKKFRDSIISKIEYDLTEVGLNFRRHEWDEETAFRGNLRYQDNEDIKVFYSQRKKDKLKAYKNMCKIVTRSMAKIAAKQFQ